MLLWIAEGKYRSGGRICVNRFSGFFFGYGRFFFRFGVFNGDGDRGEGTVRIRRIEDL